MIDDERRVIGSVLMDNTSIEKVCHVLNPDMFSSTLLKDIYATMISLHNKGEEIDYTKISQLLESKEHDRESISWELIECMNETQTSVFIANYSDVVILDWRAREVQKMLQYVDTTPSSINDTIGNMISSLESLQTVKKSPLKSLKKIVEENKDRYFHDKKGDGDVKTGFYQLDEMLVSLGTKNLTIIAARPGVGKSVFAIQIAKQQAEKGKRIAVFSLEMADEELYERMISSVGDIELTRLQKAKSFLGGEEDSFNSSNTALSNLNIDLASGSFSVEEIYQLVSYQNYDLIIIDYLQLIEPDKSYKGNRTAEVGEISRALKKMAMKLNVPIIALSQLNRESEKKGSKEPNAGELRESGSLEQDASNIIMIWDLNDDENCMYKGVKVAKCRQGKKGKIGMKFDGSHMTFSERTEDFWQWEKMAKDNQKGKSEGKYDKYKNMF